MPVTSPTALADYLFYKRAIPLRLSLKASGGILRVAVVGGADFQVQAGVFDATDTALQGAGIPVNQVAVPVLHPVNGQVVWPFTPDNNASYIQWGVLPIRSATGHYVVTVTLSGPAGNQLDITHYIGDVAAGQTYDPIVYDKVVLV